MNGSEIQWNYKRTNLLREHQLRVYPVGKVKDKPEYFATNVWNWDPEWKVEWLEDGRKMGKMQCETGLDPLSVE
ncbi:calcineurin-like phosphoesterase C-terminal domain-containing protein [Adhaeribacter terrigena]|uniref:calcineurin-like phosphoesterase C-terminal domain-containing protein n=1 Tax=Adhaeribacter terrigena TaxID=2793070 RepID=UPI00293D202A|nr:calcineurin-like phosphoesterase C-terminal domain-containing protein [Adhaeribacter terrigena]